MQLEEFFKLHNRAALGFSGGADSAYLLYAGLRYGADIRPYFVKTAFQPDFELRDAKRLAEELETELTVIEYDVLSESIIADNPENRCYYCKRKLFRALHERALRDGYEVLLDGTNASDEASDRPGMRAIKELSVLSPLRECGISKTELRRLSKEAGLFTWDKPAYACLATRVPSGERITAELLSRVEASESLIYQMVFRDFRVRVFHGAARLQLQEKQFMRAAELKGEIIKALKPYFETVLLDLNGRKQYGAK